MHDQRVVVRQSGYILPTSMRRHGSDGGGECPTLGRVNRGVRRRLDDRRGRADRVRDDGATLLAGRRDQAEGEDGQQALHGYWM